MISPVHFVGGKGGLLPDILDRIPAAAAYAEPFCGGAAVGLYLSTRGARVRASDVDEVVINYWRHQICEPERLYEQVLALLPAREAIDSARYRRLIDRLELTTGVEQAALFFICQRLSFSGLGRSGGASLTKYRLTPPNVATIVNLRAGPITFEVADYRESLERYNGAFFYLDPPYAIQSQIYGRGGKIHRDFDHFELFDAIKDRTDWLLSYNDCPEIRGLYADFVVEETSPKHSSTSHRREQELLISPRLRRPA